MPPVYKVAEENPQRELEWELAFQRSLTTAQRFAMMLDASHLALETLIRRGHRKPVEVVKRT